MNNSQEQNDLIKFYFQTVDIWKSFCEEHSKLYQLTCDEYSVLLSSEIDELENILNEKENIIDKIKHLEKKREQVIDQINQHYNEEDQIKSLSDLLSLMQKIDNDQEKNFLERYNNLLIDIIKNIQQQNKKNQIFLNKSILSLKEIREGLAGGKNFKTYDSKGLPKDEKYLK